MAYIGGRDGNASGPGARAMWQTVTREQLYGQVWSVPLWTLCQRCV